MRRSLASLVLFVGCARSEGPAPAPLVGKSRALAEQVCACKDAACAQPVEAAWNALAPAQASQLTADDVEALARETERFTACLAKLRR